MLIDGKSQDGSKGIPVGTAIAVVGEPGDDLSGAADLAKQAASEAPPKDAKEEESRPKEPATLEEPQKDTGKKDKPSKDDGKGAKSSSPKENLKSGDRIFATPIAKKIALERGIPLAQVKGSGPEGRILREDVEKFKPGAASSGGLAPPAAADAEYKEIPVSSMRRTIGNRLTESKQTRPHFYVTVDIDLSKVNKLREVFNASLAGKEGAVKLSVNDFVTKATALALAEVPEPNSSLEGDVIKQ